MILPPPPCLHLTKCTSAQAPLLWKAFPDTLPGPYADPSLSTVILLEHLSPCVPQADNSPGPTSASPTLL